MIIKKVLNNNFVSCIDASGDEVIAMGKGIGFGTRAGKEVKSEYIDKVFKMTDPNAKTKFGSLLENLPMEQMAVSDKIITYAKSVLDKELNENIYITLTDHINFAITRIKTDLMPYNILKQEVKNFYNKEYIIGLYALEIIERELGYKFPDDEAASIALHIVNAEYYTYMSDTMKATRMIPSIIEMIETEMGMQFDKTSLHYDRLVIHLKFMVQRLIEGTALRKQDEAFERMIIKSYACEHICSKKVAEYIEGMLDKKVENAELFYLTMHIIQLTNKEI